MGRVQKTQFDKKLTAIAYAQGKGIGSMKKIGNRFFG
jgi:hypothetical protein